MLIRAGMRRHMTVLEVTGTCTGLITLPMRGAIAGSAWRCEHSLFGQGSGLVELSAVLFLLPAVFSEVMLRRARRNRGPSNNE